ncbi:MAG: hypothetical protein ABI778_03040, partial [Ignavibacteriota bacterium]
QTPRAMAQSARSHGINPTSYGLTEVDDDQHKLIQIINVKRGDLHKSREKIDFFLSENEVQYIIVNSWEYAARSSRYREEVIFYLKELTWGDDGLADPEGVAVFIYGQQTPNKTDAQRVARGYGKLAGLAQRVEVITIEEEFAVAESIKYETQNSEFAMVTAAEAVSENEEHHFEEEIFRDDTGLELHFAPVFVPSLAAAHTPSAAPSSPNPILQTFAPIMMNNFSPDKPPITGSPRLHQSTKSENSETADVHNDIVEK